MSATTNQNEEASPYAEHSALTDLFGNHPKTKILAALLSESRDVNVSRIAELAGVSRTTVYDHIDDLQQLGVVERTRKVGGSPLYQINKDSAPAKKLAQLEWDLVEEYED
jgi:DNA-binding transcriptional ArsR family regulator